MFSRGSAALRDLRNLKTASHVHRLAENHHPCGGYCSPATDLLPRCFKYLRRIRLVSQLHLPVVVGTLSLQGRFVRGPALVGRSGDWCRFNER